MPNYSLRLRDKYAPDEEHWSQGVSKGIGEAISLWERQREEDRQWENEMTMAGADVDPRKPSFGERMIGRVTGRGRTPVANGPNTLDVVNDRPAPTSMPAPLTPRIGRAPFERQEGAPGLPRGITPYNPNAAAAPKLDFRMRPQISGVRDGDDMIERGRSPSAISTQRTGTTGYGEDIPRDEAVLRGPRGRTARIDRNRGLRQEVARGGIARRIAEGEEEHDVKQQVDSLVAAGWERPEAEARVRSNTVAYGRWKGEQRPSSALTYEQRVALQNLSHDQRMKLQEYAQRQANARAAMARAAAADNRAAYNQASLELRAIEAEAANDRIDLALAEDLSPSQPFDRRMMGRTPEGAESVQRGDEIRRGVQGRTEERRGRIQGVTGGVDQSKVEQIRQLTADFRRSYPNASEDDIKRWVKRRMSGQRAAAP